MVFQRYALFPWKTVEHNVAFGLAVRGVPEKERLAIAGAISNWWDWRDLKKPIPPSFPAA